jgi:hypothetical protein
MALRPSGITGPVVAPLPIKDMDYESFLQIDTGRNNHNQHNNTSSIDDVDENDDTAYFTGDEGEDDDLAHDRQHTGEDGENDGDSPIGNREKMDPREYALKVMHKRLDAMTHKAEYLKVALLRRNDVIDTLRQSYLKDVLALKLVMNNVLKDDKEREHVLATYNAYIPCVDLTAALPLHGPEHSHFSMRPCESCGGTMEVKILDADQVTKIRTQLVRYLCTNTMLDT